MDIGTLTTIVVGVGALAAALVKTVRPLQELWQSVSSWFRSVENDARTARQFRDSIRDYRRITAIKSLLEQWLPRKGAQRALLLTANNGGEAWKAGGRLYCSNPAQVVGPGEPNTVDLWQNWEVDHWYATFLGRLLETHPRKRGMLIVTQRDVGGELFDQYQRQGTVASVILPFLWVDGAVLLYVSLNFGRSPIAAGHDLTDEERQNYYNAANEIYSNVPRCRALVDELRSTWNSVK